MDMHRGRPDRWVSHSSVTLTYSFTDGFDFLRAWSFAWYSHTAVTSNWALANVDPTSFLIHEFKYDYFRGLGNHCPHEVYCSLNLNCKNKFLHRLTPPPPTHTPSDLVISAILPSIISVCGVTAVFSEHMSASAARCIRGCSGDTTYGPNHME